MVTMREQNTKVVIFDVDGVLINSTDAFGNYLWKKDIEKDLGITPDQVEQIFSNEWPAVIRGHIDTRQHFEKRLTTLQLELPVDTFMDYWLEHDTNINREIIPEIEAIKGIKLYIGTNQDPYRAAFLQKKFAKYFDGMFASHQIGFIKPEPEYFEYIESHLNMQAANIAFIDDSLSNIQAAIQRGWICHHYQNIEGYRDFIRSCAH